MIPVNPNTVAGQAWTRRDEVNLCKFSPTFEQAIPSFQILHADQLPMGVSRAYVLMKGSTEQMPPGTNTSNFPACL
jgi:hypothetical protein